MKFFKIARKFHEAEDGAVTVDWVVLTASIVGLGIAALAMIRGNMGSVGQKVANHLNNATINTTFD